MSTSKSILVTLLSDDTGWYVNDFITKQQAQSISGILLSSLEAGEKVQVSVDDGATWHDATLSGNEWSISGTLLIGDHIIQARIIDGSNQLVSMDEQAYTVDVTAPTVTARVNSPWVKAGEKATFTFDFSEDPGTTFSWNGTSGDISFSSSGAGGESLSAASGTGLQRTVVYTPPSNGIEKGVFVSISSNSYTDLAGNVGSGSNTPKLIYDPRAPAAPSAPSLDPESDTGISQADGITGDTRPTFRISTGLYSDYDGEIRLYAGPTLIGSAAITNNSYQLVTSNVDLAPGTYTVTAVKTDVAGNASPASSGLTIKVVTDVPTVTVDSITISNDTGSDSHDFVTNNYNQKISGTLSAPLNADERVQVSIGDNNFWIDAAVWGDGQNWSLFPANLATGTHDIRVKVTNAANAGAIRTQTYTLDTTAPTVSIASDAATLKAGETTTVKFVFDQDPGNTFTWNGSAGDVTVTGGTLSAISGSGLVRTAIFTPTALTNGATATISANIGGFADKAGNANTAGASLALSYDTLAPAVSAPQLHSDSNSGATGDTLTKVATPVLTGTAEDGATVRLYDSDGVTEIGSAVASGGSWSITTSSLAEGEHTITARASDAAGNVSAAPATLSLTIDSIRPSVSIVSATPLLKPGQPTTITFSFSEDPGDSFTQADIVAPGGVLSGFGGTGTSRTAVFTPDAGTTGAVTISVRGNAYADNAGNIDPLGASLTLHVDAGPPPQPPVDPVDSMDLVDGVPVWTETVVLPGGAIGTAIRIPIVTSERADSTGTRDAADIPLAQHRGESLLLAQVPVGAGLNASGASLELPAAGKLLQAMLAAATGVHGAGDRAQLAALGQSFLAGMEGAAQGAAMLVESVKPRSIGATDALLLSGQVGGPDVALVIDTSGMAAGGRIALEQIDFATILGAADVAVKGSGTTLSGDGAAQRFTVDAGEVNSVFGGGGDDVLAVGQAVAGTANALLLPGATVLHGGQGSDTASFAGARSDYVVEAHHGYVLVSSKASPETRTMLVNVETLRFSDTGMEVSNDEALAALAGMYQGIMGRQADLAGIGFWADAHASGLGLGAVAVAMIGSQEGRAAHGGFNGDADHDISLLYQALFDRAPDSEGLAYWTRAMANGASLEQVAESFVESAEMVGLQPGALDWNFGV